MEQISLEGAGILLMDDKPVEVDRAIAAFLQRDVPWQQAPGNGMGAPTAAG